MDNDFQILLFNEDDLCLEVRLDTDRETVWLTQVEMAKLFGVDRSRITRHVNGIIRDDEVALGSNVRKTHFANADRPVTLYGLDMILAVGYRVNSKRGIAFRRWANGVLKQYLLEGYALNEKRLAALHRTVEVQRALLVHYAEGSGANADEVLAVLDRFTGALNLLDDYDHQCLAKPEEKEIMVAVTMNMTGK